MRAGDGSEMLTGNRRVLECRERRWGKWGGIGATHKSVQIGISELCRTATLGA